MAGPERLSPSQRFYLLALGALILGPFLPLIIQSLAFRWAWPDLLPSEWWLTARERARLPLGWDYVLSPYSRVWEATLNTLAIGLGATGLSLVLCLPAARVLARRRFAGKAGFELFLALPLLLPEMAIGIPLLLIYVRLGLAGSHLGIVVAHLIPTIPYMIRMLTAVYQGLDRQLEEQARVLGAKGWQVFRLITLPLLMPGVVAGCLFTFLVSTNVFLLTFLLGQGRILTLPTLLFAKIGGGQLDASAAGLALVMSLPGLVLLVFFERFVRQETLPAGQGD